jgi:hypothetical protein
MVSTALRTASIELAEFRLNGPGELESICNVPDL